MNPNITQANYLKDFLDYSCHNCGKNPHDLGYINNKLNKLNGLVFSPENNNIRVNLIKSILTDILQLWSKSGKIPPGKGPYSRFFKD